MSMRRIAERFQHSTSTIHRIYRRVMRYIIDPTIYNAVIRSVTADTPLSDIIVKNPDCYPYSADCVGAVDVCDLDMNLTNVLYGWEGSVADSHLWTQANRTAVINIPERKDVLGDAGFVNCKTCLLPYRNVRYHVQEWTLGNRGPQKAKELFNLRHSKLRNAVERIFGVMKARYKILTYPRPFRIASQLRVVAALCTLHNILNYFDEEKGEAENNATIAEDDSGDIDEEDERRYNISQAEKNACAGKQDAIATRMWRDYLARKRAHPLADLWLK